MGRRELGPATCNINIRLASRFSFRFYTFFSTSFVHSPTLVPAHFPIFRLQLFTAAMPLARGLRKPSDSFIPTSATVYSVLESRDDMRGYLTSTFAMAYSVRRQSDSRTCWKASHRSACLRVVCTHGYRRLKGPTTFSDSAQRCTDIAFRRRQ